MDKDTKKGLWILGAIAVIVCLFLPWWSWLILFAIVGLVIYGAKNESSTTPDAGSKGTATPKVPVNKAKRSEEVEELEEVEEVKNEEKRYMLFLTEISDDPDLQNELYSYISTVSTQYPENKNIASSGFPELPLLLMDNLTLSSAQKLHTML